VTLGIFEGLGYLHRVVVNHEVYLSLAAVLCSHRQLKYSIDIMNDTLHFCFSVTLKVLE
jgi:hypothetical protein